MFQVYTGPIPEPYPHYIDAALMLENISTICKHNPYPGLFGHVSGVAQIDPVTIITWKDIAGPSLFVGYSYHLHNLLNTSISGGIRMVTSSWVKTGSLNTEAHIQKHRFISKTSGGNHTVQLIISSGVSVALIVTRNLIRLLP